MNCYFTLNNFNLVEKNIFIQNILNIFIEYYTSYLFFVDPEKISMTSREVD